MSIRLKLKPSGYHEYGSLFMIKEDHNSIVKEVEPRVCCIFQPNWLVQIFLIRL